MLMFGPEVITPAQLMFPWPVKKADQPEEWMSCMQDSGYVVDLHKGQ